MEEGRRDSVGERMRRKRRTRKKRRGRKGRRIDGRRSVRAGRSWKGKKKVGGRIDGGVVEMREADEEGTSAVTDE
jgi:hypothetical protein